MINNKKDRLLHSGHRTRLRKRLRKEGLENLYEHEFLEYILSFAIARKDTNDLGHTLLKTYGSLENVFNAPYESLIKIKGIGEASATFIATFNKMFNYVHARKDIDKREINSENNIIELLKPIFKKYDHEVMIFLLLDSLGNVFKQISIDINEKDSVTMSVKSIVENIKKYSPKKVVVAHNHLTGSTYPSKNDINFTKTLFLILSINNITLLDHYILADNLPEYSFDKYGLLKLYKTDIQGYLETK